MAASSGPIRAEHRAHPKKGSTIDISFPVDDAKP